MAALVMRRIQNLPPTIVSGIRQDPADQCMKLNGALVHRVRTWGEWRPLRTVFPTGTPADQAQDDGTRQARVDETRVGAAHHSFWLLPGDGSRMLVTTPHINDTILSKAQQESPFAYPLCTGCQLAQFDELAAQECKGPEATKGLPLPVVKDATTGLPQVYLRLVGTVSTVANAAVPGTPYFQATRVDIISKPVFVAECTETCMLHGAQQAPVVDLTQLLNRVEGMDNNNNNNGNGSGNKAIVLLSAVDDVAENRAAKAGVSALAQRIFALKGSPKLAINPAMGAFSIDSFVVLLGEPDTKEQVVAALDELCNVEPAIGWFTDDDHFDWL